MHAVGGTLGAIGSVQAGFGTSHGDLPSLCWNLQGGECLGASGNVSEWPKPTRAMVVSALRPVTVLQSQHSNFPIAGVVWRADRIHIVQDLMSTESP